MSAGPAIGVLGGTFDPVHRGHLAIARTVLGALGLARVHLLPAWIPPHKMARPLTAARHRRAMLRLAVSGRPGLRLDALELDTEGVCYTIDSLRRLRRGPPPLRPVFILGMDSLFEIPTWRDHDRLLEEFDLAVVARSGPSPAAGRHLPPEVRRRIIDPLPDGSLPDGTSPGSGGRVFRIPMTPVEISSTEVRRRAAAGLDLGEVVPPAVARYIRENRLYVQEERR